MEINQTKSFRHICHTKHASINEPLELCRRLLTVDSRRHTHIEGCFLVHGVLLSVRRCSRLLSCIAMYARRTRTSISRGTLEGVHDILDRSNLGITLHQLVRTHLSARIKDNGVSFIEGRRKDWCTAIFSTTSLHSIGQRHDTRYHVEATHPMQHSTETIQSGM